MSKTYAPDGYNQVTPYLTVNDAHRLVRFLVDVFDAQVVDSAKRPDGKLAHASIRIGDSYVQVAEATERFGPMPGAMHIYVPDTDKTHQRAVENGALVLHEPMEMDYGERASAIMDVAGNHWYIATYRRK